MTTDTLDALAEKYLDALHAGESPSQASYIVQVEEKDRDALRRRLRFMDLMHRSRPTGGRRG